MPLLSPEALREKISLAQACRILVCTQNDRGGTQIYFVDGECRYLLGGTWRDAESFLLDEHNYSVRQRFDAALYQHNLDRFTSLAQACFRHGRPCESELQLLERLREKYAIPTSVAVQILQGLTSNQTGEASTGRALVVRPARPQVVFASGPAFLKGWLAPTWKKGVAAAALLAALSGGFWLGQMRTPAHTTLKSSPARVAHPGARKATHPKTPAARTRNLAVAS